MKRDKVKMALMLVQIVCFPVSIALANGPAKWLFVIATMMLLLRFYLETLEAPNNK